MILTQGETTITELDVTQHQMEKFLQNIGWIDVDGPYGRMVRKDMEDEFLHGFTARA